MIYLGSDPEWFVKKEGKIVSAIGTLGGTKRKPRPMFNKKDGFFVQEDNVTLEYNTPPADSLYGWLGSHETAKKWIQQELKPLEMEPVIQASHTFSEKELDDPRAWVFGCEPDFNVWKLEMNPRPKSENPFLRSAGGHIHVGYNSPRKEFSIKMARMMDLLVGLGLMLVDPDYKRMELYGKAGAIRFKKYGFEYRTPSNFWTSSSKMIEWVYKNTTLAFDYVDSCIIPDNLVEVINTQNKKEGLDIQFSMGIEPCKV